MSVKNDLGVLRGRWGRALGTALAGVVLGLTACQLHPKTSTPAMARKGSPAGMEECDSCHRDEEAMRRFTATTHGRLAAFEVTGERGCVGCHGTGTGHKADPKDPSSILRFQDLPPAEGARICLRCHASSAPLLDWEGSAHPRGELGCIGCHRIHVTEGKKKGLLRALEPELCYECHREKRAQVSYPSHHPIPEGKMQCSDCHEVHGAEGPRGLREVTVNDLCVRCHAEKQGPFAFEHAPTAEGCILCHEPHGTVAEDLKRQNEPFLCLQCHTGHRDELRPTADLPAYRATFFTQCSTCHLEIHGTDAPTR
ncbi:MAG: DmsE family decaheme c-type cytochrome [Candidatus Tectomicrobia bacterium]|uniref:DmsE family decaheme c-type cytochrome n=1 Tax=Tectimicrobiota bacterium TaxID=2528274 RepID=A0A932CL23_UNCTE|nr:DmsE family decaheme c-type cytochrome [Candidatus Tectomicrobia bacterium]